MRRSSHLFLFVALMSAASPVAHAERSEAGAAEAAQAAPSAVLMGAAALIEVGRFDVSEQVNRDTRTQSDDLRDLGGALVLGYLHGLSPGFRLGGNFMYSGFHSLSVVDSNQTRSFGQRLALDLVGEGIIRLSEGMDVLVGGRVGTPILIPGGDFKEFIRVAQAGQYRTNAGPRFGLRIGVDADVRFRLKEHFALRVGAGYAWTRTWLMSSKAESELSFGRKKASLTLSQIRLGAGIEWLF
jgi:hypothetical protein